MSANPTPTSNLTLVVLTKDDATVVQCSGRLVAGSTEPLHTCVKHLIPQAKRIVLDLTDVTHVDSMGLGTVVALYVSARTAGSRLELINFSKRVRDLLSITNVLSLFEAAGEPTSRVV
jgi:anti-sigma B factor antagonist